MTSSELAAVVLSPQEESSHIDQPPSLFDHVESSAATEVPVVQNEGCAVVTPGSSRAAEITLSEPDTVFPARNEPAPSTLATSLANSDAKAALRPPPTAAELGAEWEKTVMTGIRPEYRDELRAGVGLVDREKLMQLSGQILGTECRECHWIAVGGSRFVFALLMSNGMDVIARVCRPDEHMSGPPLDEVDVREIILSEVATLKYISQHTTVPVANVLGYDCRRDCGVGSGFILQERLFGAHTRIDSLDEAGQQRLLGQIVEYYAQIITQRFRKLGSLYEDLTTGEISVQSWGPALRFFEFPALGRRGPFETVVDWFKEQSLSQIDKLDALEKDNDPRTPTSSHRAAMRSWYASLHHTLGEIKYLRDRACCPFVLLHEDFQLGNILMAHDDPSRVVGILDWEGARSAPLWATVPIAQCLDLTLLPMEQETKLGRLINTILVAAEPEVEVALKEDECLRALWAVLSDCVFDSVQWQRNLQDLLDDWPVEEDLSMLRLTDAQQKLLGE